MKTLINANKVSLNFNLRQPKKVNGSTPLYAVVKVEGKQIKISLNFKVCAWQWDNKKQVPIVNANMTQKDIDNAMAINEVINEVRTKFYYYLCSGEHITETTIKEVLQIQTKDNDMANKNAIPPKRTKTATKLLLEAFSARYGTEEKPKCAKGSYRRYMYQLKRFLKYLELPNIYDSAKTLNNKTMYDYKKYLEEEAEKKGEGSANNTIKQCNLIISLINEIAANPNHEKLGIREIKSLREAKKIAKAEQQKRELTAQEINAVNNVVLNDERLEFYRDCFNLNILSGVRVGDLKKLLSHDYKTIEEGGKKLIQIVSQKETVTAVIIVTDVIKKIIDKYANGLPYNFKEEAYNRALKEIFELANLTYIEKYVKDVNGVHVHKEDRLCDIISSHYCRHTFITKKLREGWSFEKVCYLTGHANDKQVREVYAHLTEVDKGHAVLQELDKIESKKENTNNIQSNEIERLIAECKDVLVFLGAKYENIADINEIDTLLYKVYYEYYKPFADNGIDVRAIKGIYNTKGTSFKEKQMALQVLLCEAKEKELISK